MTTNEVVSSVSIYGLGRSLRVSGYPMSVDTDTCTMNQARGIKLSNTPAGSGHDCFLKGIIVQFDLTLSLQAWMEAERYHWFEIVSSQSKMHKLSKMDVACQCNAYVDDVVIKNLNYRIDIYNQAVREELPSSAVQYAFNRMIYNVPTGYRLRAGMTTNYLQLKTIYNQRKNHRLYEWQLICDWIESLPNAELIIGVDRKKQLDEVGSSEL
jgi:hypothetical protein